MNNTARILNLVGLSILLSGCALIPQTSIGSNITAVPIETTHPATIQLPSPTTQPSSQTPPPLLLKSDQVIFTIPNTQPWSGMEGDPRPDWKGWGAETFAVAPDGTFWIADTAVFPNRLLHYSPQGELLQGLSLQDIVVYAYDILVTQDAIWLLDISAQQPRVIKLSLDGELLSSMDIPQAMMSQGDMFSSNGAFSLVTAEDGKPLLATLSGYYKLEDSSGEIVAQPVEELTYSGHTYQEGTYDPATGQVPVYLDGALVEIPTEFKVQTPFLGINPDGSFALAGIVQETENQWDPQVKYFDAGGNILGSARQNPQTFYKDFNHHLALDQDGIVYQLLSFPDHSVQVLRLGFTDSLSPWQETISTTPTPLAPLSPVEPAAEDADQARNNLIGFFADLSAGNYAEAAARFGGEVDEYLRDQQPGESVDEYWNFLCDYYWCLPVTEITAMEQISENEYTFYTVFMQTDGRRFEIGACCGGDPAAMPPVWQFAYPVQKIDGVWKVMRPPLFTP